MRGRPAAIRSHNPEMLAGITFAAPAAKNRRPALARRLLGDLAARPGTSFRPDPPDLLTLREVGRYLPSYLGGELPAHLHGQLKFRLAQMFQMIDELEERRFGPM